MMTETHFLDLQGETCPYTYVRTKLLLEELPLGATVQITIDHPPARESLPRAALRDRQELIAIEELGEHCWRITLRKTSEL